MSLVWRHAEVSGNPRWKGLSMGMVPSHASGLCACTYHIFYTPYLGLAALQAALDVGNATMGFAAYGLRVRERAAEGERTKYTSKGFMRSSVILGDMTTGAREAEKDGVNGDLALGWKDTSSMCMTAARAMQRQQIVVADVHGVR